MTPAGMPCTAKRVYATPCWSGSIRRSRSSTASALDAFLRELAADDVLVSAHPETILRLGTKDVLVATQTLG
jgi:hypothetical protein